MSAVVLSGVTLLHTLLILLPMAACALLAARFGVTDRILLVMAAISGGGLLGFAVFWVYLASSAAGRVFAILVDAACALVLLDACRSRFARWRELKDFAPVTVLFAAAGLFYVAMGYLYGGLNAQGEIGANRFVAGLPGDSWIPMLFAQELMDPHRPLPHYIMAHFESSDRPPLQTGFYLMQQALLGGGRFLDYQVMGTLAQGVWVFALWAFFRGARQSRWALPLCAAAVLFSGFAMINSFYTWPKLLAGACMLLACAVLLTPELRAARGSRLTGALTGATLGCSMLGHPGTIFVLAAVLLAMLLLRCLPSRRFSLAGAGAMAVAYVPWMLYGKYYQPPANALIDLQLAHAPASKPGQSTLSVIIEAYRKLTWRQILDRKLSNFATPFDHTLAFFRQALYLLFHAFSRTTPEVALHGRLETNWPFYYVGPTLGLVGLGIVIMVVRGGLDLGRLLRARRSVGPAATENGSSSVSSSAAQTQPAGTVRERWARLAQSPRFAWRWPGFAPLCLLSLLITYVFWALTLIGPNSTIVHQGSYFVELLGMVLGFLGWWSLSRRAAAAVVGASAVFTVYIYLRYTPDTADYRGLGAPFKHGVSPSIALLLAFAILACLAALWWLGRATPMPPATPAAPPSPTSLASIIHGQGAPEADPDQTATKRGPADARR